MKWMQEWIGRFSLGFSLVIAALLFFLVFKIFTPLLNSGDDAFLMYTLAGGYGDERTHLLHYNHGWHPAWGWVIKSLFTSFPGTNWYTLSLVIFHFAGCVCILFVLLSRAQIFGVILFLVFFFFLESRLLLSISFTSTAMIAAIGGVVLLHCQLQNNIRNRVLYVPALLLILFAGILRLHIAWLVMLLFVPLMATTLKKEGFLKGVFSCGIVVVLLVLLNLQHSSYYTKHIPGWKAQEEKRQALFYAYNRPIKENTAAAFSDSVEMQLYFSGFLYDTAHFTTGKLTAIGKNITRQRWLNAAEDREGLYWFFMEMRIYLLLFGVAIAWVLLSRGRSIIGKWLFSLAAVILIYGGLFVFLKLTPPLHIGLIAILWLQLAVLISSTRGWMLMNRRYGMVLSIILLFAFSWMGIRIVEENLINISRKEKFQCALNEINKDREKLFVATDDSFPLSYFPAWANPVDYPATNLLYKDRLLSNTYRYTLKRFHIENLDSAIVHDERVFLLGKKVPALEGKYDAQYSGRFPAYKCLEVRKLLERW